MCVKAIVHTKYGPPDVLQLPEMDKPTPRENEALIKIHAASVNAYDWHMLTADIFLVRLMGGGLIRPKNPALRGGSCRRCRSVGEGVQPLKAGDRVFGDIAGSGGGRCSEFAASLEKMLALKPANLPFEQAAAVPMAGITALQGLRDVGQISPGKKC